jgi:hypothetical protein
MKTTRNTRPSDSARVMATSRSEADTNIVVSYLIW